MTDTKPEIENVLADRLGLDFVLGLNGAFPEFKKFEASKEGERNFVAYIDLQLLGDHETVFRLLEDAVTNKNKDFLADKALFLYIIATRFNAQERPGFIVLSNVELCTILSVVASIRVKSNKGSHFKPENVAKQKEAARTKTVLWHFNFRIYKVYDCLSKYFLISQDKATRSWTLENPIIGDCVQQYEPKKLREYVRKLTKESKPKAKTEDPSTPTSVKKNARVKAEASSNSLSEEFNGEQYVLMDMDYSAQSSEELGYPNLHPNPISPTIPQQVVSTVPYLQAQPPYQSFMIGRPYPSNNNVPMSQIERDTGVPDYVWKLIETKARDDPHILIKMIDTLIPLRDRVQAMEQQGKDPRLLFVRSADLNQRS